MATSPTCRSRALLVLAATVAAGAGVAGAPLASSLAPHPDFPGPRKGPLVAGIGFGHTSTTSLAAALRRLGLRTKHWAPQYTLKLMCLKLSGGEQPESGMRLQENVSEQDAVDRFEWGWQALSEVDAILDEPVNVFWKHIYRRFPDTLFVLTKRNVSLWADSEYAWYDHDDEGRMMSTDRFKPYWRWCRKFHGVDCQDKLLEYSFGKSRPNRTDLILAFNRHVEEVRKTIPPNQLLEMDISAGDGYEKLAPFIGMNVPKRKHQTKEFPHDCNGHCIHPATKLLRGAAPEREIRLRSLGNAPRVEVQSDTELCDCGDADATWMDDTRLPFSSEDMRLQDEEEDDGEVAPSV